MLWKSLCPKIPEMPVRIIIADDHPMLVEGLTKILLEMDDVQILQPVSNGRHLIDRLHLSPADLVILDLQMPRVGGMEVLPVLKKTFPRLKVIVFSNYNEARLVKEIKELGADAYLLKNSTSTLLKETINNVLKGEYFFPEEAPEPVLNAYFLDEFTRKYQLTNREIEIIRKIAAGHTSKAIAEQLFVSEFTVSAHRRNICRKLNIYTPVGLMNFVKEQGII